MVPPGDKAASLEPDPILAIDAAQAQEDERIARDMAALYDHYFATRQYELRYPKPNRATLRFLFDQGVARAGRVLDFGCGDGRYAVPLLEQSEVQVTGYDISQVAIARFDDRVRGTPLAARTTLICADPHRLEASGPYGMILALFGVLGHVGDHAARIAALRQMRRVVRPDGCLVVTVPSLFRRRPLDLLRAKSARISGRATGAQREPGNIFFTRRIADAPARFFYHLYSVRGLRRELAEAGFELVSVSPESLLPEWLITQSEWIGRLDEALLPLLPASLGYGIRAVARPRQEGA